mmetsp:Transcript_25893/g.38476  ORF Transcript_25893/g.38476 Transcript_25893/m.38476 type:complete len:441 (-) Transcript_25893:159-1481(-)
MVLLRILSSHRTVINQSTKPSLLRKDALRKRRHEFILNSNHKRSFSTANGTTAATTTTPPTIISRRAYEHYLPSYPRLSPSSTSKSSSSASSAAEEKPWPRPMRIGFYVFTALCIPYTMGCMVASSAKLRDYLEGDRPDLEEDSAWGKAIVKFVRENWGKEEERPYVDGLPLNNQHILLQHNTTAAEEGYGNQKKIFILEGEEETSLIRMQQREISVMKHSDTKVRITLEAGADKNGRGGVCAERTLSGETPVNLQTMKNAVLSNVNSEDLNIETNSGNVMVATARASVDFVDSNDKDDTKEVTINDEDSMSYLSQEPLSISSMVEEGRKIRQMTPIYSAWNHFPSLSSSSNSSSTNNNSSTSTSTPSSSATKRVVNNTISSSASTEQIRISELEWNIEQLTSQLKDPNCTRDIDTMEQELKEAKRELRKLKGWFGFLRK